MICNFNHDNELYDSIDTNRMINFISKFGVDHVGFCGMRIINFTDMMTNEQIDIFFSYKPSVYTDGCPYFPIFHCNNIYLYTKLIEYDSQGSYVFQLCDHYYNGQKRTQLQYINEVSKFFAWGDLMNNLKVMLNNHKNRHFTFFDHLKHLLDKKRF